MVTPSNYFLDNLWLIPLFPLISALLILLVGSLLPKNAINFFCLGSIFLSLFHAAGAAFALVTLDPAQRVFQQILFEWVTPGQIPVMGGTVPLLADWGYLLDPLSSVVILIISGVGFLIHVYSIGYLRRERSYYRFFGYLNLLMFSMLTVTLANNLLLLFAGWECASLSCYLLVGFYFEKKSPCGAGRKILIVNHVADASLLLCILLIASTFGTIRFTSHGLADPVAFAGISETLGALLSQGRLLVGAPVLTIIGLLLFGGAMAKSAQLPFQAWMSDSTEAVAPVGAMIQTASLAVAGVYLVARMYGIYQVAPVAMDVVVLVGALTAVFAALIALAQTDINKILAYSTMSQLGFIFLALGAGAFSAGVFHLMTHAFFKALLLLAAGCVIYATSGERDLCKMGGLWNLFPAVSRPFLIATLAIAGIPPLAGFFSGSEITSHLFSRSTGSDRYIVLWVISLFTAGLTTLYAFRLLFLVCFGLSRVPPKLEQHIQEIPRTMTIPLVVLSGFCLGGGWFALPRFWGGQNSFAKFLEPVVRGFQEGTTTQLLRDPLPFGWFPPAAMVILAFLCIWLAYRLHLKRPQRHARFAVSWPRLHSLLSREYYFDELYDVIVACRIKELSATFGLFDTKVIDGFCIDGAAWFAHTVSRASIWWENWVVDGFVTFLGKFTRSLSHPVRMFQTGLLSSYAVFVLIGLVTLLLYYSHHMQALVRSSR